MGIQKILPNSQSEDIPILVHKYGEIISINESMYRVKIYREPDRKIFTTCLERAYIILQSEEEIVKMSADPFCRL